MERSPEKYRKFPLVIERVIQQTYDVLEIKVLTESMKESPEGVSVQLEKNAKEKTNFKKNSLGYDLGDGRGAITVFYSNFQTPKFPQEFEKIQPYLFTYGERLRIS